MAVIETKFDLGDVVWYATTTIEAKQHPCPDCLGERVWEAKSPAGTTYRFACPRCAEPYMSHLTLSLKYGWHEPAVRRLTIGLVQPNADIDYGGSNPPAHRYMCHETGIGSGTTYREDGLFSTEEEAFQVAQVKANIANLDPKGRPAKQYADTLKLSDYQLKDAEIETARTSESMLRSKVGWLIADLEAAETIEEIRSEIERWKEKSA